MGCIRRGSERVRYAADRKPVDDIPKCYHGRFALGLCKSSYLIVLVTAISCNLKSVIGRVISLPIADNQ